MRLFVSKKGSRFFCLGATIGFILILNPAAAQTVYTWNGSANSDWFNSANWTPNGVPAFNDIINFTNGTINLSAPVTIGGQFNWSSGVLSGEGLTIASGAVMNINGISTLYLECGLTNAGTVTWTNFCSVEVLNGSGLYFGSIENQAGALFDIQSDESMYSGGSGPAYFINAGTLQKSSNTGTTSISIPVINSGTITALHGDIAFYSGGPLTGTFTAASGTAIDFASGNFTNSVPVIMNGPGPVQFAGGTLLLLTDVINNLALTGGTVELGPAFQGGSINNLTIAGSTLSGTNTVTGTFNWDGGIIAGGPLTIASTGVMNINALSTLYLESPLINAGTVTWTNFCSVEVLNGSGLYSGLIQNQAGALFDIQSDESMYSGGSGPADFLNAGTLQKSSNTGTTYLTLPVINSGTITALHGDIAFYDGGPLTGTFTAASGTAIDFASGNFTNSVPVIMNGPGLVQFTGGTLTLLTDVINNLALTGGTVELGPAFQGGSINNLTIAGSTLSGTNTVTGTFNWNGGIIAGGPLTIASTGVMNINGTSTFYLESPLINAGTVTWTNFCSVEVLNGSGLYSGLIQNLAGALFDIQSDESMYSGGSGPAAFLNAGTLQKSSNTGTTYLSLPVTNSGSITALHGNLAFYGSYSLAGGALLFGLSSPTSYGTMSISGNATLGGTVGAVLLNGFTPAIGNSFNVLSYGSYTGMFAGVKPSSVLWQTNYGATTFTLTDIGAGLPMLSFQWSSSGFLLQLIGNNSAGPVTIYASTDLVTWVPIFTSPATNGTIQFLDSAAINYPQRFYQISGP